MPRLLVTALSALFCVAAVACGSDDTSSSNGQTSTTGSPASSSTSGTDPASSLGPQCTKYLDCCKELASKQPALAGSCDSTKSSIEDAQKKGASTDSYESACKSALGAAQQAGYCK